jgi:hypothetical protein
MSRLKPIFLIPHYHPSILKSVSTNRVRMRPRAHDLTTLCLGAATLSSAALGLGVSIGVWLFESLVHPIGDEIEGVAYLLILCGAISLLVPPVLLRVWFERAQFAARKRRVIASVVVIPNILFQAAWIPVSISALFVWHRLRIFRPAWRYRRRFGIIFGENRRNLMPSITRPK